MQRILRRWQFSHAPRTLGATADMVAQGSVRTQGQMLCSAGQEIGREIEIGDFVNAETWRILLELYILFDRDRRPRCAGFGMCCNFSRLSTDESFLSLGEIRKSSPVKVRGMSSMMRRIREETAEASRPH